MKFTLNWLKDFLDTDADIDTISATLTRIGLEVEGIEDNGAALRPFTVAHILSAEKHPDADKLQVCKVMTADGEQQIVCGAPNARAGIKVALAKIGTVIPTNEMKIKAAKVRGVESNGMLCSARELGLGDDHAGIMELPENAEIGTSIVDLLGLDDPVIEIAITPNRGDCLGVYGIARDLAAAGLGTLITPTLPSLTIEGESDVNVRIEDVDGCSRFIGRTIKGVKNGASPDWLQQRLQAIGLRPISLLVDITNYFTFTYGRPLHVYDIAKLKGNITVRAANAGVEMEALNDKSYTFKGGECAICDESGEIGLGGIVGGASTGVDENTTDVFLECAWFNPLGIAATGRALQVDSDARYRFERTVDASAMEELEMRASMMIIELCGGTPSKEVDTGEYTQPREKIPFSVDFINQLGGTELSQAQMVEYLTKLGFGIQGDTATPPSWRPDVTQPADLAEEVLRLFGYDNIEAKPLPKDDSVMLAPRSPQAARLEVARDALANRSAFEAHHWAFCSQKEAAPFGGQSHDLTLRNPISSELSIMRPNLLPHLLSAAQRNADRGAKQSSLFEIGPAYGDSLKNRQQTVICAVRTNKNAPQQWQGESRSWDVFDAKADALSVLEALGMDAQKVQITRDAPDWYHPGRSGALKLGPKNTLGYFGELHPVTLQALGIDQHVVAIEIFADAVPLPKKKGTAKGVPQQSDFQASERDFAFVVDADKPSADLVKAISSADKNLIRHVRLFDVYAGKGVAEGKTSLALTITLQAPDRTLKDDEIDAVSKKVVEAAAKLGAELRS